MKIRTLFFDDIEITVVRKRVKNINLAIYPPYGEVWVSAPQRSSDELIRSVISSRLQWIRKKREALLARALPAPVHMVTNERHLVFGQEYQLLVIERTGPSKVSITCDNQLHLVVKPGTESEKKKAILYEWYRARLRERIPNLVDKWQRIVGVEINEWRIRRMKTRWGTCNISDKRIWLNLELARPPLQCLEYVIVHELVHLLERYHNRNFWSLMDRFMPDWEKRRAELQKLPVLSHV